VGANQSVGVGWVANDADLNGLLGNSVDGGTLSLENLSIRLEQVRAFHSWASGPGTDKHADIGVLETNHRVSGWNDVLYASVGTILELHDETLEDLLCGRQLDELHDHLSVRSKHSALGNEVAKEGTDLSSGASDSNANGGLLLVEGHSGEVTAEGLKSAHKDILLHFVVCESWVLVVTLYNF